MFSLSALQDFEWMMTRVTIGTRIKIISTFDAGYSDTSLSKRVASGDISVERLLDYQVELKIAEVKTTDAGFYWCQTPSTDSVISGTYEARVQLTGVCVCVCVCVCPPPPSYTLPLVLHNYWLVIWLFCTHTLNTSTHSS